MRFKTFIIFAGFQLLSAQAFADLPCESYGQPTEAQHTKYNFSDERLSEISGLALSHTNKNFFWAHVDSGGPTVLYLLNRSGEIVHTYDIDGAQNVDWEDIAVAVCPEDKKKSCIYIADTGDNLFKRTDKKILIIEEPAIADDIAPGNANDHLSVLESQEIEYSNPNETVAKFINPDCESLMVHPKTGEMYIVSKQSEGGVQTLYHVPRNKDEKSHPEALASYTFTSATGLFKPLFNATTGADFSPDGNRFVVRTYANVYEYDLTVYPDMGEAFNHPVEILTELLSSDELQGEAVAYDVDGASLVTAAEKYDGTLSTFEVHNPAQLNFRTCNFKSTWVSPDPDPEDPGKTDPDPEDPGKTDPDPEDPGKTDPDPEDPGKTDPDPEDPGKTDPDPEDPGKTDPDPEDPGKTDPDPENPGKTDPENPDTNPIENATDSGCSICHKAPKSWLIPLIFLGLPAGLMIRRRRVRK